MDKSTGSIHILSILWPSVGHPLALPRAGLDSQTRSKQLAAPRLRGYRPFLRTKTSKVREVQLHDLRHFMATQMLNDGVPIAVVAGRLAHVRASTTLNVYAHAVPGGDRDAAEGLARRLVDNLD